MPKKYNKEFIELLIDEVMDNSQRDFVKAFNDFLERMPYFHAFYMSSGMYAFANSELKQTSKTSDIHWKLDNSGKR